MWYVIPRKNKIWTEVVIMQKPTLKQLAAMDSGKWYDVRTTISNDFQSCITARKKGAPGRYFLAWSKEQLMKDVHYGEMVI